MNPAGRAQVLRAVAAGALVAALAGCVGGGRARFQTEQFESTTTHARDYASTVAATCEAARRALLSQGYVITLADAEHVNGKKNFQPEPATHVEVEFHVVCATADRQGRTSIAFVNALQDRYALKKSNNSASLGVGVLGSVSLPFASSDDAMVKIASETITTEVFYDRFFALLDRYMLSDAAADVPVPAGLQSAAPTPAALPSAAPPASAPAAPAASAASAASAAPVASSPARPAGGG